jgi:hypothetical protein
MKKKLKIITTPEPFYYEYEAAPGKHKYQIYKGKMVGLGSEAPSSLIPFNHSH